MERSEQEQIKRKKTLRKFAYVGIVGGLALISLATFSVANYFNAKLKSSDQQVLADENVLCALAGAAGLSTKKENKAYLELVNDTTSIYNDKALYYYDALQHFEKESKTNATVYIVTSVIAYTLSILTLVSFGLVLKDADKQKELEDK